MLGEVGNMKRRLFNFIFVILMFIPVLLFTGCFGDGNNGTKNGKVNLASKNVRIEILGAYYYTGEPIEVPSSSVRVYINDSDNYLNPAQLTIECRNNIEVGTADLIITAKEDSRYVYGTVTTHFEIEPNYKQGVAENFEQAKEMFAGNYYKYVRVTDDFEIPAGETLTVPNGKTLRFTGSWSTYKNFGTLIISDDASASMGNDSENKFFNYGTVITNNKLTLVGRCYTFNSGEINGEINASSSAKIYTNTQVSLGAETPIDIVTIRKNLTDASVFVSIDVDGNNNCRYVDKIGGKPAFIVDGTRVEYNADQWGGAPLKPSYIGADDLGTATATLVASDDNKNYFGQITKDYNIIKGQVEFTTYQELVGFQNSGFYDEYISGNGVGITGDFTLNAGETLWTNSNYIKTTFTNYGTIKPLKSCTLSIEGDASFINLGNIIPDGSKTISIEVVGTFSNGSVQETDALLNIYILKLYDFQNNVDYRGRFNNYSTVQIGNRIYVGQDDNHILCTLNNRGIINNINDSVTITNYGTINNYGEIDGFNLTIDSNGIFKNFENATIFVINTNLRNGSQLINNLGATFTFGKNSENTTIVERINITNHGAIVNNSTMDVYDSYLDFVNDGTFDSSDGHVWGFDYLENKNITGNLTVIKRLSQSDIVLLGVDGAEYDGTTSFKPTGFTVDGETLDSGDYRVSMKYAGSTSTVNQFINAGIVEYEIRITNSHNKSTTHTYGGKVTERYTIQYGTTTADNSTFVSTIQNRNWGTILLSENVVYHGWGIELEEHQTIDTNGHTLSINTNYDTYLDYDYYAFTNNGKIIVRQVGNGELAEENCGLKIYGTQANQRIYRSTLKNYGTIQNEGIIYVSEIGGMMSYSLGSSITGDGKIFTWDHSPLVNLDTGNNSVYTRSALAAENIELAQSEFNYNYGTSIEPQVTAIKYGEQNLNIGDYTITYQDNINAGTAKVVVEPKSIFDEHFISGSRSFTINKILGYLNSTTINTPLDAVNYYRYNLTENITLTQDVTFPDGLIVDYGDFRINTNNHYVTVGGADTQIWVNINSSNVGNLSEVRSFADKITITSDISVNTLYLYYSGHYSGSGYRYQHADTLTIDINGHAVDAFFNTHFTSNNDMYLTIIDSSAGHTGIIQNNNYAVNYLYGNEYYALGITDSTRAGLNVFVELRDVTVYGMAVFEIQNANNVRIKATNCTFKKPTKFATTKNYKGIREMLDSKHQIILTDCDVEE